MTYEAKPGTLAFRALAHMGLLHKGSEISNPMLAGALNCVGGDLIYALKPALNAGIIFSRQKGGHAKSPFFWSLVERPNAVTTDAPRVIEPQGWASVVFSTPEPVCDHGESLDGECLQCRAEIVRGRETPAEIIEAEMPAPIVEAKPEVTRGMEPREVVAEMERVKVLLRAPADPSPARWGLFSDGEFHIQKAGQRIELDRAEFEGLVAFLERMAA